MKLVTLNNSGHPLADAATQRATLALVRTPLTFEDSVAALGRLPLETAPTTMLQMNLGKRCNQACRHCHVDAGPDRREVMTPEVVDACLRLLETSDIPTVDITGGAPELHPLFREIVSRARGAGRHVIDRCNLTITRLPSQSRLPEFLAEHRVEVIASLPSFSAGQTDAQRGDGVFEDSIAALQHFNTLGYGVEGSGLLLHLMTNPVGAFLPGSQRSLEVHWKREMHRLHGVTFNRLYTMTNMPISRFLQFLLDSGNLQAYMDRLTAAFNPDAIDGLMCRHTLSVAWDGRLYDCDFNQMLEIGTVNEGPQTIFDVKPATPAGRQIAVGPHCFGCTAGSGSSCGGATT